MASVKTARNLVVASVLGAATAGCAGFGDRAKVSFSNAGSCSEGSITELGPFGGFASMGYNEGCGDRALANTFLRSSDAKMRAVGATIAARTSPLVAEAIADVNAGKGEPAPKQMPSDAPASGQALAAKDSPEKGKVTDAPRPPRRPAAIPAAKPAPQPEVAKVQPASGTVPSLPPAFATLGPSF